MTQGWTERVCPKCKGSRYDGGYTCLECGGTGREWGEVDDESPPKVEEPPTDDY